MEAEAEAGVVRGDGGAALAMVPRSGGRMTMASIDSDVDVLSLENVVQREERSLLDTPGPDPDAYMTKRIYKNHH